MADNKKEQTQKDEAAGGRGKQRATQQQAAVPVK